MTHDGVIVAAPSTGSGKTTVTLGLLRAFARRGVEIRPAKVGPDYIDPRFHEAACGQTSVNLDGWAMRPALVAELARDVASAADLAVVEGVMGLFDGAQQTGTLGNGTTADIARFTGWPVILVVDCSGLAQSVAPLVEGFRRFDPGVRIAGAILNKAGGPRHWDMLREALEPSGLPVFGVLPRDGQIELPSRHLGLVQAEEHADLDARLSRAADLVETHCDLEAIRSAAGALACPGDAAGGAQLPPLGQRIAVADDVAFRFVYPHQLAGWRNAGAEIVPFSPLADQAPDANADVVFLPGGYPELHAGRLAAAQAFADGMRQAAAREVSIYGECGGYMVLGQGLVDAENNRHRMLGLLDLETSFAERGLHLGYRDIEAVGSFAAGAAGSRFRGHEFHYASVLREEGASLFRRREDGSHMGLRRGPVAGSFAHLIDVADQ